MRMYGLGYVHKLEELRTTTSGFDIRDIAVGFKYGKAVNGKRQTQWIRVSVFGKRAAQLPELMQEGQTYLLTLRDVRNENFAGRDGQERTTMKADLEDFEFLPLAAAPTQPREPDPPPRRQADPPRRAPAGGFDDDIPF